MKPHDNCPYCRELLVSVEEFRHGAIQCLGIKRVEALAGGAGMVEMTIPAASPAATTVSTTIEAPRGDGAPNETSAAVAPAVSPVDTAAASATTENTATGTSAELPHAVVTAVSQRSATVPAGGIIDEATNPCTISEDRGLTNNEEGGSQVSGIDRP